MNRSASPEKEKIVEEEEESAWDSKFQYLLALLGWAVGLGKIKNHQKSQTLSEGIRENL